MEGVPEELVLGGNSWLGGALGAGGVGEALHLAINFLAQVGPDFLVHIEENLDDFGIELPPRPARNFSARRGQRLRRAVGAIGSDGIERVGDGEHAGTQRNLIALEATRV